jgi:hypothetical protein
MDVKQAPLELYDIEEAAQNLRHVLGNRSAEALEADFVLRAAAERFVLRVLERAVAHLMQKYDPEGLALRERLKAAGDL